MRARRPVPARRLARVARPRSGGVRAGIRLDAGSQPRRHDRPGGRADERLAVTEAEAVLGLHAREHAADPRLAERAADAEDEGFGELHGLT